MLEELGLRFKKIFFVFFLIFIFLFFLVAVNGISPSDINKNLKISESKLLDLDKVYVKKVIDGDTFKTNDNKSIRLIGINTPEIEHHDQKVEYFGREAAKYTKDRIEGKTVFLEYGIQKRDKYQRVLAYVYLLDGTFFNAELVKKGYADLMTIPPNIKYTDLFQKLAKEARIENRGLWDNPGLSKKNNLKEINWRKAGEFVGEEVAVTGKVIDTYDSGKAIFLNYHKDYKHTFTAVIFKSDEYKFNFEPEKYYLNKKIKVKGKIKVYKGAPEIIVEEPSQIKLINPR
ncbi:MAG: thermonuclease family protein [Candidatus Mcinerneyibacterium aminivorans]|uniref:Thermonuclease family protein n=1 Tax=Candidatus Mcinerneyibacterium aminivorans TaxID=2703815 RepID=A0A5D0MI83_9BACT|nr:MAG: thermonuclease family protein [Candidatus Mcinerneyibacterium aminivorans]